MSLMQRAGKLRVRSPTFDELEAQAKAMETKMRHDIQNLHPDTPSLTEPPIGASSFLQESPVDPVEDAEMEREAKLGAKVSWDDLERSVKATEAKTAADLEMVHDTHFPHAPLGASSFLETSSTPTFDE